MEENICRNYLSHHQATHRHTSGQFLGLSYHARLCDYRILPWSSTKSRDSKPKGLQKMWHLKVVTRHSWSEELFPRKTHVPLIPFLLIARAHQEIVMAQYALMSDTVDSNISDINSQHSYNISSHTMVRLKKSFQAHHILNFTKSIQLSRTWASPGGLPGRFQYGKPPQHYIITAQ